MVTVFVRASYARHTTPEPSVNRQVVPHLAPVLRQPRTSVRQTEDPLSLLHLIKTSLELPRLSIVNPAGCKVTRQERQKYKSRRCTPTCGGQQFQRRKLTQVRYYTFSFRMIQNPREEVCILVYRS